MEFNSLRLETHSSTRRYIHMSLSTSTSPAHIPIWLTLSTHKLVTLLVVIAIQQQGDCKGTQMKRGKRLFTAHTHPPLHVAQNICYGTHTQTNSIWLAATRSVYEQQWVNIYISSIESISTHLLRSKLTWKDGRRGLWLIDKLGDYEESAEWRDYSLKFWSSTSPSEEDVERMTG